RTEEEASLALAAIYKRYYARLKLETRDKGYRFYLHPLVKITPGPELSNQMGSGMPDILLIMMSVLAAIIMVMACFNYTNLMIAKSLSRAREIGVRKIVGAQRWQVFAQFVGEAMIFSLCALAISYLFLQVLKPAFLQMRLTREFPVSLEEDVGLYLYFLLFAVVIGIIAGLLPAGYLSAFRAVKVLKDPGNIKVYSRLTFRKILMVTQFALSLTFIIVVFVIYRQMNFMVTTDYGIDDKNTINVRLQGLAFDRLANEMRKLPGVIRVGGVSHSLGTWADGASDYRKNKDDAPFTMRDFMVDENYLANLDVKFLAGGNFEATKEGEFEKHVILNETALKGFGFKDPVSAVGQTLYVNDTVMLAVIGVMKDFHFRPLSYQIGPLAMRYNTGELGYVSARIVPSQKDQVVAALEAIWKKLDPVHPLEWQMMEDQIDQAYDDAGFSDILTMVGYIGFLAITIACLGMLGMAMYATQTRVKEIGVRKVMGASVPDITLLLSKSFLMLIGIAVVVSVPISFWLGTAFLELYAYKIQISVGLILSGVILVLLLGLITICSQTIKAALTNPVKSLRYE
ncbi:MAG: FtsX-like permease family protein, partial [Bacteroidota bacterium]